MRFQLQLSDLTRLRLFDPSLVRNIYKEQWFWLIRMIKEFVLVIPCDKRMCFGSPM